MPKAKSIIIAHVGLALLTACSTTTPRNSLTGYTIAAPTALELNQPTELQVLHRTGSGAAAVDDGEIKWSSSNPGIASVAANGTVTARRFGDVTITATVNGTSVSTKQLRTYGLEAAAGVHEANGSKSTAMLIRYRTETGSAPATPAASLRIEGPAAWNSGQAVTFGRDYTTANVTDWFATDWFTKDSDTPPVEGTYVVTLSIAGRSHQATATIDATSGLGSPANLTVTNVPNHGIEGTWSSVTGARSYTAEVYDLTTKQPLANRWLESTWQVFEDVQLNRSNQYLFQVYAHSLDITASLEQPLQGQFDVSWNAAPIMLP